jgi:hypothetical protein
MSRGVLFFYTLGLLLDVVAIVFMISGSSNGVFSLHGILGYSATATIAVDVGLIWYCFIKNGLGSAVNNSILLYSKIAYAWWLIVYFTGSLLIIWPQN